MLERIQHFSVWFFWYEELKYQLSLKFGNYNFTALKKQKIQVRCVPLSVIFYIRMKEVGKYFMYNSEKVLR